MPGISREDSDDELGDDDLPWEWIYADNSSRATDDDGQSERKRRKFGASKIVAAKMGSFECCVGDIVLLKAEGSNEAWVALICEFVEDDDGEKAANFMWFSTEKEIRNRDKKRTDFYWVSDVGLSERSNSTTNLIYHTERTLRLPLVGYQPSRIDQWKGKSYVIGGIFVFSPIGEDIQTVTRFRQDLCVSSRLQYQDGYVYGRVRVGRDIHRIQ